MESILSPTTVLLIGAWGLAITFFRNKFSEKITVKSVTDLIIETFESAFLSKKASDSDSVIAPGPTPLPIIGNIHQLAKYEANPYEGFTELSKKYGSVYSLKMGTTPALVVSSSEGLKEVLINKGQQFDGRPDFHRWNLYFDGNRQHSLALCDWSSLQKTRRQVIRNFLLMKSHSKNHENLDQTLMSEMDTLMAEFKKSEGTPTMVKIPIQWCAMNVFLQYMCDMKFEYSDPTFQKMTKDFDLIFEDINNGHPTDFLPWLAVFCGGHLSKVKQTASDIRNFILDHIINKYKDTENPDKTKNVLEGLLANHKTPGEEEISMDWNNLLFALEDLLGGSSAISNVMIRVLTFVAKHPDVLEKLQTEASEIIGADSPVSIDHRREMPYTEATIMEVLRHTSSPIVPHVANADTTLEGYTVEKGTVVFINNYALNNCEKFWDEPEEFKPERFIKNGQYVKPSHFLPFSTGKRACVGSKILIHVCFVTLVNIIQKYNISLPKEEKVDLPIGRLAVVGDGFNLQFNPRSA